MSKPLISVVLPAYQVSQFIGEALESVFAQTFRDFEVVVVNDGSPDTRQLEAVLAPYRDRIIYIVQENGGVSSARNTAVRAASGEWIASLDPDDLWEPEYLQHQVDYLGEHPELSVVYGDAELFGPEAIPGSTVMQMSPSEGEVTFAGLIRQQCTVIHCATLAKRQAIIDAGLFDEALRSSEDFDLWVRIVRRGGKIAYHRERLAKYRRHSTSLTANRVWIEEHYLRVLQKTAAYDLTLQERAVVEEQQEFMQGRLDLARGKQYLAEGDYVKAIPLFRSAQQTQQSWKLSVVLVGLKLFPTLVGRFSQPHR